MREREGTAAILSLPCPSLSLSLSLSISLCLSLSASFSLSISLSLSISICLPLSHSQSLYLSLSLLCLSHSQSEFLKNILKEPWNSSRHRLTGISLSLSLAVFVDEDDIAKYVVKTIDDPRAKNKTVYLRPPENVLSQRELVNMWEEHIGMRLKKTSLPAEEFLRIIKC